MTFVPDENRYEEMSYRRSGRSGLLLPLVSVGLWHNFGDVDVFEHFRPILRFAFDKGITHFDLANNYGPPPGSAEENFGRLLKLDFGSHRDEMVISTKAGYRMWPGPYGEWGSRKYLISSLDQSLRRMGLDYVDIFYSHRPDPDTPLEETMAALDHIVRQGKALYVGLSNYSADETTKAVKILNRLGTPCIIHQPKYSMLERWVEGGLLDVLEKEGIGCIPFSPLAQGLLTDKYINGIPPESRAAFSHGFLQREQVTPEVVKKIVGLNIIAKKRGQKLAQMALSWLMRDARITSVLVGVRTREQLEDLLHSTTNILFDDSDLTKINEILS